MVDHKKKICIVTACGNKKHDNSLPAWKIYKSPRISAVYKRKGDCDMYILSAKHALVHSEKVIEPYNMILEQERIKELLPSMVTVLQKYDKVIFFKAGARSLYENCMKEACNRADVPLDSFGFGFMGDIGKLEEKIRTSYES